MKEFMTTAVKLRSKYANRCITKGEYRFAFRSSKNKAYLQGVHWLVSTEAADVGSWQKWQTTGNHFPTCQWQIEEGGHTITALVGE
jgi:hypothetical protein